MFNKEEVEKKVVKGYVIESMQVPILAQSTQRKHERELRKRLEAEIGLDVDTAMRFAHFLQTVSCLIEFCEIKSFGGGSSKEFSVGSVHWFELRFRENAYWSVQNICYTHTAKFLHLAITEFMQRHTKRVA